MIFSLFLSALLLSLAHSATLSYSVRQITSPSTSKTYLLHNSHSSTSFRSAVSICDSYPGAQLAILSPSDGDIDFLGQFIESLEEPYWIGGLESSSGVCAALYAGGAVAIPKPSNPRKSPCESQLNVICEMTLK